MNLTDLLSEATVLGAHIAVQNMDVPPQIYEAIMNCSSIEQIHAIVRRYGP